MSTKASIDIHFNKVKGNHLEKSVATANDKTTNEKMKPSETPSEEIIVGIGSNLYHRSTYTVSDHPITKYPWSAFLKFSVANTDLLDKLYSYFEYNAKDKIVSAPHKGWLIADECAGYYLPELFFYNEAALIKFLKEIGNSVKLKRIMDGLLINTENLPRIIKEAKGEL